MKLNEIKTSSELLGYVGTLKVENISWHGKRRFCSSQDIASHSMSELVQKVYDCYSEKYSLGSCLSSNESNTFSEIIKILQARDKETDEKLRACSLLTRIAHAFASLFGNKVYIPKEGVFTASSTSTDRKKLLANIAASITKTEELSLLQATTNTHLHPSVKEALDFSYQEYYSKPFPDSFRPKEAKWEVNGETIHRYNHGLAHAARKAFSIPFILKFFEKHGLDHLTDQLKDRFAKEGRENVIAKLQIVMAFEVAGRESECGSRDNLETYTKYLTQSKDAFKQFCYQKDLIGNNKLFKDEAELESYAKTIKEKFPNRSLGNKMDVITAIVDASHTLDEFRCYWPSRMREEIGTLNTYTKNKNTKDLLQLAKFCQELVKATGDRLMTEIDSKALSRRCLEFSTTFIRSLLYHNNNLGNSKTFVKCSKGSEFCWEVLEAVSHPQFYNNNETTFELLRNVNRANQENQIPIEELKTIISGTGAAIRLINAENGSFQFETEMLDNPVFLRPIRPAALDRDFVLANRETREVIHRGYKDRLPLREQMTTPKVTSTWGSAHQEGDRGKPSLTPFTKKLSLTLLRKDGKIKHFQGQWPTEYYHYNPVGMLYDVTKLDEKQNKFVWDFDVASSSKFWMLLPQSIKNWGEKNI